MAAMFGITSPLKHDKLRPDCETFLLAGAEVRRERLGKQHDCYYSELIRIHFYLNPLGLWCYI